LTSAAVSELFSICISSHFSYSGIDKSDTQLSSVNSHIISIFTNKHRLQFIRGHLDDRKARNHRSHDEFNRWRRKQYINLNYKTGIARRTAVAVGAERFSSGEDDDDKNGWMDHHIK
jgi:hypothetical protein